MKWGIFSGFLQGIKECRRADEKASVDGVKFRDLFSDGGDFSVNGVDLGGVIHVEDLVEFIIDEKNGPIGWRGCIGGTSNHFRFENVVGHSEDKIASHGFLCAKYADAVSFFEFGVELEGKFDGDIFAIFAQGGFEDIGVISGDNDDFFDAAMCEVLDIALDEAHAPDEFEGFDIVGGFGESAAEAGGEDDGLFWGI